MASYLTQQDLQNFGSEMVDLAQRAAMHAVTPELRHLEQQSADLQAQLARETQRGVDAALERAVPNWREINRDPRWLNWLMMPDLYSGQIKQRLLDAATARGAASSVIALFNGFLREAGAAGQAPAPAAAASYPTTASGRPIYTREQIRRASEDFRKGRISEQDYRRLSADFCRASGEGRVIGGLPLDGGR